MKIWTYYLVLLAFIVLLAGFMITSGAADMAMPQMLSLSAVLAVYVVAMSLVGEGKAVDERASQHRYLANRFALVIGTVVLSAGVIYQLFHHILDLWLLAALVAINLAKTIALIYSNYRK